MSDSTEELIQEIAVKHGVGLSRDDPILILQTINHRLMQDSQKAQEAILDQYKQELEEVTNRWSTDAKDKAERILNAAIGASKEVIEKTLQDTVIAVRKEVEDVLIQAQAQLRAAQRLSMWNFAASTLTILVTGIISWSIFYR